MRVFDSECVFSAKKKNKIFERWRECEALFYIPQYAVAYRIYDRKHICSLRVNVNSSVPKPFIFPAVLFLLFTLSLLPVPVEMPGPPTNIAISNISPRSVTLQFKPGYDGKTSISRWLVEAQVLQKWDASSISFKASHSLSVFISHR